MDVEALARKLEPLCPKQVANWRKRREAATPDVRQALDQALTRLAQRHLGKTLTRPLFSLAPSPRIRGKIRLGHVLYEKPKWPAGISEGELLQSLAIFGRSGAGKTNVVFHLLEQLSKLGIPWLFWDWKRTARHLLPRLSQKATVFTPGRSVSPLSFNPLIPPPSLEPNLYITQLVDIMASAFTLGDGARSVLEKSILACYQRDSGKLTPEGVIEQINSIPDTERVRGWKISALRALESIVFSSSCGSTAPTQEQQLDSIFSGNTIIELDALSDNMKDYLVPALSLWCYAVRMSAPTREKLNLVIVVEEAHQVLYRSDRRSESIMDRLLRQCREIGIGMIIVDQHPSLISPAAIGNCYTTICLNLKDPTDINRAAGITRVPESEKGLFSMLPCGQGVVKLQDRWHQPFLVQFPLMNIAKGSMTDELLRKYLKGSLARSELRRVQRKDREESQLGSSDRVLTLDEFRLIHDVLRNPDGSVRQRMARLHFSGDRMTRVKGNLLDRGWLIDVPVKIGKQLIQQLRIPSKALAQFGRELAEIPPERIIHDYWQRHYAAMLQDQGFAVQIEAERVGGRVDVLAENGEGRIAIEVETGKSDVVANVRNCLRTGFGQIFVVATDSIAQRFVGRQLGGAGLLIPNRLRVTLAGETIP